MAAVVFVVVVVIVVNFTLVNYLAMPTISNTSALDLEVNQICR